MQNVFGLTPPEADAARQRPLATPRLGRDKSAGFSRIALSLGRWLWEFLAVLVLIVALGLAYLALLRDPSFVSEARL
ncbi:MAG: hypothetical protein AAGL98_09455, partial [Planctomycetota bacterium]